MASKEQREMSMQRCIIRGKLIQQLTAQERKHGLKIQKNRGYGLTNDELKMLHEGLI